MTFYCVMQYLYRSIALRFSHVRATSVEKGVYRAYVKCTNKENLAHSQSRAPSPSSFTYVALTSYQRRCNVMTYRLCFSHDVTSTLFHPWSNIDVESTLFQ